MFQILDATEENDFEDTIKVSLIGTEMVVEPEDRSDHEGAYFGGISDLESSSSNLEIYLLANWEPVQVDQDRCDVTVKRFLSNFVDPS